MPVHTIARLKIKNDALEPIIESNDALGGLHIAQNYPRAREGGLDLVLGWG
jgi:hypothetical protein